MNDETLELISAHRIPLKGGGHIEEIVFRAPHNAPYVDRELIRLSQLLADSGSNAGTESRFRLRKEGGQSLVTSLGPALSRHPKIESVGGGMFIIKQEQPAPIH